MPDVFDQLEAAPAKSGGDVFDQLPQGDVFDQLPSDRQARRADLQQQQTVARREGRAATVLQGLAGAGEFVADTLSKADPVTIIPRLAWNVHQLTGGSPGQSFPLEGHSPIVNLPEMSEQTAGDILRAVGLPGSTDITNAGRLSGTVNAVRDLAQFFATPTGVSAVLSGKYGPELAKRALAMGFAADMTTALPEASAQAGELSVDGSTAEQTRANLNALGNFAFAAGIPVGAVRMGSKAAPFGAVEGRESRVEGLRPKVEGPAAEIPRELDWMPRPEAEVEGRETRVESPAAKVEAPREAEVSKVELTEAQLKEAGGTLNTRPEAGMETRTVPALGLERGPREPVVSPELAETIEALRQGYRPEVEAEAAAPTPNSQLPTPKSEPLSAPADEAPTAPVRSATAEPPAGVSPSPAPTQTDLVDVPVRQVPAAEIALKPDLMQFKRMDDSETGVNAEDKLAGQWDDRKAGNLLLWEPRDPAAYGLAPGQRYIVANGHHRFEFGQRAARKGFNAHVVREADGFSAGDARALGAELNIAEGKGTIYDQARFIRNEAATRGADEALARARRIGAKGRQAASIALSASDDLYTAFINERVKPDQAAAIATAAPGNAPVQAIGLRLALNGEAADYIRARLERERGKTEAPVQTDMFGNAIFDDAKADAETKRVVEIRADLKRRLQAIQGAARNPELAKAEGVDVRDPAAVARRIEELKAEQSRWESEWWLQPDLVEKLAALQAEAPAKPDLITKPGLISGSALDKWADETIQRRGGVQSADPELLSAYAIKGAALIERGVRDFAPWSAEMLREFGEVVRPQMYELFNQSKQKWRELVPHRYEAKPGDDFRRKGSLLYWLTQDLVRSGDGRSSHATDGRFSFYEESARSGSDYVTITDSSGTSLVVRYSDHFAPGGGGFRVTEYGSGRSAPPDYNVVKGKVYALADSKWKQIGLAEFRDDLVHFLNYDLSESATGGPKAASAGIKTPTGRPEADKGGVSASQTEGASALTGGSQPQPVPAVKPDIITKLEESRDRFGTSGGAVYANPLPEAGRQIWRAGHNLAIEAVKAGRSAREAIEAAWEYIRSELTKANIDFDALQLKRELYEALNVRQQAMRLMEDPNTSEAVKQRLTNVFTMPESAAQWTASAVKEIERVGEDRAHNLLTTQLESGQTEAMDIAMQAELARRYQERERRATTQEERDKWSELHADLLNSGLSDTSGKARVVAAYNLLAGSPLATAKFFKRQFMGKVAKAWNEATAGKLPALVDAVQDLVATTREEARKDPSTQAAAGKAVVEAIQEQAKTPGNPIYEALKQDVLTALEQQGRISPQEAGALRDVLAGKGGTLADAIGPKRAAEVNQEFKQAATEAQAKVPKQAREAHGDKPPQTDSALDKAIRAELRRLKLTLGKLVNESGMTRDKTGQDLAARMVAEMGLSGEAAQRFVEAFNRRWQALLDAQRDRTLARLDLSGKLDRAVRGELWAQLAKDANLGILTDARFFEKLKKRYGVPEWTPDMGNEISKRVLEWQRTPEGFQRDRKIRAAYAWLKGKQGGTVLDYAREFLYSDYFNSTIAWIRNFGFTGSMAPWLLARDVLVNPRAFFDVVRSGAPFFGAKAGLRDAADVLGTGEVTGLRLTKYDEAKLMDAWRRQEKGLRKWIGTFNTLGTRFLVAGDVPYFRTWQEYEAGMLARDWAKKQEGWSADRIRQHVADVMDYGPETRAAAQAQALAEGLSPKPQTGTLRERAQGRNDYWRRVDEIIQQKRAARFPELSRMAVETGLVNTLNSDFSRSLLGEVGRRIATFKSTRHGYLVDWTMPVIKVIINAADMGIDHSPVLNWGRIYELVKSRGTELRGQEITNPLTAKRFVATAFLSHAALAALAYWSAQSEDDESPAFRLHGRGPMDSKKRKMMPEGWQPHSFQVGNKFYNLGWMGPLMVPLDAVANYQDAARYGELSKKDALLRFAYALNQMPAVVLDQAGMQGFADLISFFGNRESDSNNAMNRMAARVAKTASSYLVPGHVRHLDQLFDPTKYKPEDIQQALMAGVPFARRTGHPDLDWRGQPMTGRPWDTLVSESKADPLGRDLLRLGLWVTPPHGGVELFDGVPMSPAEQYEFTRQRQQAVYRLLNEARKPGSATHKLWETLEMTAHWKREDVEKLPDDAKREQIIKAIGDAKEDRVGQSIINRIVELQGAAVKARLREARMK